MPIIDDPSLREPRRPRAPLPGAATLHHPLPAGLQLSTFRLAAPMLRRRSARAGAPVYSAQVGFRFVLSRSGAKLRRRCGRHTAVHCWRAPSWLDDVAHGLIDVVEVCAL